MIVRSIHLWPRRRESRYDDIVQVFRMVPGKNNAPPDEQTFGLSDRIS